MEITLGQTEYVQRFRAIVHSQLRSGGLEDLCCPELHELYRSLLGAIAYLSHTRVDIVVFICALQRYSHQPQVQHARKLNKLLSWLPVSYTHLTLPTILRV